MSAHWDITYHTKRKPQLKNPIFVEGLPGIGSVGKIAIDFIIEQTKAKKLLTFSSHAFPPSVFVNEQNLVEMPAIEVYYKKSSGQDYLFLSGDLQPVTEVGCYTFSEQILDIVQQYGAKKIITLGGIALNAVPKNPQIYCTGNDSKFIGAFKRGTAINPELYGVIGPIVGISGLLLGLAQQRGIPALTLLVETYAHPMHLGLDGSRALLKVLKKKLKLDISMQSFEREISQLQNAADQAALEKNPANSKGSYAKKINYIG
jgi:uncharacterized protein (TIGR00162 family)